jgi:hypothetical protein
MHAKLLLGQIVATPGALEALGPAKQDTALFLSRHQRGDWGDLCEEDKKEHACSVRNNFRILSAHVLNTGVRIWIVPEADRSVPTIFLPEED